METPVPGEIYWADLGAEAKHPILVVSLEKLNRGNSVVAVPFTSQQLEIRSGLPHCVPFSSGESGLPKDCVAQAECIGIIDKSLIDLETGPIGHVPSERMRDVILAIGETIAAICEQK